jgi:DNA (cytosine-5)-methyltransferase 1
MGYHRAGFDVYGVDIRPQPRYPFWFQRADSLTFPLVGFDVIHASPPCQAYTNAQKIQGNQHPQLIEPIRARLRAAGVPYVIENVPGAPLDNPVTLCGASFGLKVYRHRLFEANFPIVEPLHPQHQWDNVKMGRQPQRGEFIQPVGHFTDVEFAKEAMGIDWMTRDELREAIPPAYTQWIGLQMLSYVRLAA